MNLYHLLAPLSRGDAGRFRFCLVGRLTGGLAELFAATPGNGVEPALSPEGRWLAYASSESGIAYVYVWPFPPAANGGMA